MFSSVSRGGSRGVDRSRVFCSTEASFLCRPEALGGAAHSRGQARRAGHRRRAACRGPEESDEQREPDFGGRRRRSAAQLQPGSADSGDWRPARFDGLYVLCTNSKLPTLSTALAYRQLWRVEQIFRTAKSILETRPIYYQLNAAIIGP